jgi:hypothetical protein
MIWLPWSENYSSWNWTNQRDPLFNYGGPYGQYPDSIKRWEFAVCSVANPTKRARVSLPDPHDMSLGKWTPGEFPVDKLEALGEGTFLCAILGDGRRYSNVSRVTINYSRRPDSKPTIRILAVTAPEGDIRGIGLWVIPAPSQAIHVYDVCRPYICINGKWSGPGFEASWNMPNGVIPETGWGTTVSLQNYDPPIKPFKKAQVRVKIIEDFMKQSDTLPAIPFGEDISQTIKKRMQLLKGYTSDIVPLSVNETDPKQFDQAFGIK